jgi:transcriptional regulator with XRE-family HTH domain
VSGRRERLQGKERAFMQTWTLNNKLIEILSAKKGYHTDKELAKAAGVSKSWIEKAKSGAPVRVDYAEKLAKALDVLLADLGKPANLFSSISDLYPLVGLWGDDAREFGDDVPFQNWLMKSTQVPNNPVAYLWASPNRSKIFARVIDKKDDPPVRLRVEFENAPNSYPCNIAIHPTEMIARKTKQEQRFLTFEVIFAEAETSDQEQEQCPHISISVRVRDANLQQWVYVETGDCSVAIVNTFPATYAVDLKPDIGKPRWMRMRGEQGNEEIPDFRAITTVVFEVGRSTAGQSPRQGKGVIEFGKLLLREQLEDGVTLL